ncbi:hypothetical protein [Teredinibacter waterburyi]|uniref:hypothetical protein n=1 Tax=Teredinibacter waterburyi TaxID=1500538 RepID=UPI00165F1AB6|nr:hypothetical protein [Teredinibacter waterburyi]
MPYFRAAIIFITLCFTLAVPFQAQAQTGDAARLERIKTSLAAKQEALATLENRLLSYVAKQEDATTKLAKAEQELAESRATLEAAKGDASEAGLRQLSLAEKRLELDERGVLNRGKRLDRINRKTAELEAEAADLQAEIAWAEGQLGGKKVAAAPKPKSKPTPRPTPRPAAVAAPKPTLAPTLAPTLIPTVAKTNPVTAPAPTIKPTTTPKPALKPTPRPVAVEDEIETIEQEVDEAIAKRPKLVAPIAPTAAPLADEIERVLTPRERYARRQMKRLNDLTKDADKGEHRRYDELLMRVDRDDEIELEYLGNEQFYGEVKMTKGRHKLTINLSRYVVNIPKAADGDTFVVIYDTTDLSEPKFIFFNKNLLD